MSRLCLRQILAALSPVVLVLALMGGTLLMPSADAAPANEVNIYYYSDDTYTQEVGWRIITCSGNGASGGDKSPYYIIETYPCL